MNIAKTLALIIEYVHVILWPVSSGLGQLVQAEFVEVSFEISNTVGHIFDTTSPISRIYVCAVVANTIGVSAVLILVIYPIELAIGIGCAELGTWILRTARLERRRWPS